MSSSSLDPWAPSRPSARQPYRAESTPPRQPYRLGTPSPLRLPANLPPETYPESPTASRHRRLSPPPSPTRPTSTRRKSLTSLASPRKNRLPSVVRSPRKAAWTILGFGVFVLLMRALTSGGLRGGGLRVGGLRVGWYTPEEELELCRFVSPVEAYHRDLARLRALYRQNAAPTEDDTTPMHRTPLDRHPARHRAGTHHSHIYSPTGHLLLSNSSSGSSPHPIPQLLTLGETRWEDLLSRQSRSLPEAVREYSRRYGRPPPKGFDMWWEFAMLNNLVLPDEYDRINLDLAPFFALPKEEMKRRMRVVEEMKETFTIVVEDGAVHIQILDGGGLKWDGTWPRAQQAGSLIKTFARFLPDMKATFSIFDQPQIYLSWGRRGSLVELGLRGEHTTHLHETDNAHVRLSRSCPPDSHFRNNSAFSEGRSFIYDHLEATDICQNPYVVPLHGLTIEPHGHDSHPRPHTQLLPLFSLAKTSINSDILVTPLDQFADKPGKDPKWEEKTSGKLAWRGSPTGISMMTSDLPWRQAHRIRLHHFANNQSTAPLTYVAPDFSSETVGWREEEIEAREGSEFWFDMQLAGQPLQCEEWDGTCDDMRREIEWAPFQKSEELNKHKFLLDIDGNGWSGRFRRYVWLLPTLTLLMSTNSVVIKATLFTEWFQPHLIPWFMYIPSKLDFSDLPDIMSFFSGTPSNPEMGFDETAKALARNGVRPSTFPPLAHPSPMQWDGMRTFGQHILMQGLQQCFAQRMFRLEDLQAYMMRLFLEYARLAADDGVDMDFYLEDDGDSDEGLDMAEEEVNETDFSLQVLDVEQVAGPGDVSESVIEERVLGVGVQMPFTVSDEVGESAISDGSWRDEKMDEWIAGD